jgi:hypothetical protein
MKNKGFRINFTANAVTITKAFEEAAGNPNSEEYALLKAIQADYPNMKIIRKTCAKSNRKKANPSKGLTYESMERYINVHKNAPELLAKFEVVKELSAAQKNKYLYVKNWFIAQFPNYNEIPDFSDMNIVALKPVTINSEQVA